MSESLAGILSNGEEMAKRGVDETATPLLEQIWIWCLRYWVRGNVANKSRLVVREGDESRMRQIRFRVGARARAGVC